MTTAEALKLAYTDFPGVSWRMSAEWRVTSATSGGSVANLTALAALFPLSDVRIASRRPESRERLAAHLRAREIPTAQYYPKPLHKQTAYESFPVGAGGVSVGRVPHLELQ